MAARLTAYLVVAIVGATLIAGLIVGAQRDDSDGPVDLIVQNGAVYTADGAPAGAEAVAVRGNRILRVGSEREIARLRRPQTVVVDAGGGAILPGFIDAEVRLALDDLARAPIDLTDARGPGEAMQRLAAWSEANPGAPWVVGRGLPADQPRTSTSFRQRLDEAAGHRPALVLGADRETAWANSSALRLAGIHARTPDPAGGLIGRDPRTGEPSGLLRGAAAEIVWALVPPTTAEQRTAALRAAMDHANSLGVTSVHSPSTPPEDLPLLDRLRRSGDLTVRVYSGLQVTRPLDDATLDRLGDIREQYPDDPLFKVGALHLALDGSILSGSAALLEPYASNPDAEGSGDTTFAPDDLNRTVRLADAAGWQVMLHATGDRAARIGLDAFAHAVRSNPAPRRRDRRHRLGGLALVDAGDRARLGTLDLLAAVQPPAAGGDRYARFTARLGAARAAQTFPYRSLASDARLIVGSGWPASSLSPLTALQALVGATEDGAPAVSRQARERLELGEALDAYTSHGAWGSFDEQRKGTLASGMLADIVVLTRDIVAEPRALSDAAVAVTIFDGRIVYRAAKDVEPTVPSIQQEHDLEPARP